MQELFSFDEFAGLCHESSALGRIHPGFEMPSAVEPQDRRPVATITPPGRRLEIHSPVAGIFRLGGLDAAGPFPILMGLAGLHLAENHLVDFCIGRLARLTDLDGFAKIPSFQQRHQVAKDFSAFGRLQPAFELRLSFEIQNSSPRVLGLAAGGRDYVAADVAGKPRDHGIVFRLPGREGFLLARTNDRSGYESGVLIHVSVASFAKMRSALKGRLSNRRPVASSSALLSAGATGMIGVSPADLAPSGP